MLIIKIKGGLGNQMFEYAMARKIQLELGIGQIGLDTGRVDADRLRNFGLDCFCLCSDASILETNNKNLILRTQEDIDRRLVS